MKQRELLEYCNWGLDSVEAGTAWKAKIWVLGEFDSDDVSRNSAPRRQANIQDTIYLYFLHIVMEASRYSNSLHILLLQLLELLLLLLHAI